MLTNILLSGKKTDDTRLSFKRINYKSHIGKMGKVGK